MKTLLPVLILSASSAIAQQPQLYIRGPINERSTDTLKWTLYNDAAHRAALHEHQSRAALQDWKRERRYATWKQHIEDILLNRTMTEEESRARGAKPRTITVKREWPPSHFDADLADEQARYEAAVDFFRRRPAKASSRFVVDDSERWNAIAAGVVR